MDRARKTFRGGIGSHDPRYRALSSRHGGSECHRLDVVRGGLAIDRSGFFRYKITSLKGERVTSGEGVGHTVRDMSRIPEGTYFLIIQGQEQGRGETSVGILRKIAPWPLAN